MASQRGRKKPLRDVRWVYRRVKRNGGLFSRFCDQFRGCPLSIDLDDPPVEIDWTFHRLFEHVFRSMNTRKKRYEPADLPASGAG